MEDLIRLRDDDVGIESSSWDSSFKRFQEVHNWTTEWYEILHVPTILVNDIKRNPAWVKYVRDETEKGNMLPEIHGHEHVDFAKLSKEELVRQFGYCKEFIANEFGYTPKLVMSPWGANAPHISTAAEECGLKLRDCSDIFKLGGRYGIIQLFKDGHTSLSIRNVLREDLEIFTHFWEGGLRIKRVVELFKHGSWAAAEEANWSLFNE